MKRRTFLLTTAATAAAASLPRLAMAAPAGGKRPVLRYVAEADLTSLDPVWSTAYITQMSAELVYDTLFGFDEHYAPQLQMLADAKASADGRQWTLVLRPGLLFHDGTPVRAQDCVASIRRWGSRDTLGQELMKRTADIAAPDVHTIVFKLNKPFPLLPNALGKVASSMACIMPERLAKIDAHTQITEAIGSGPFRFAKDKWVSGSTAVFDRFDGYVPRPGAPGSFSAGAKVADVGQVVWKTIPDAATSSAALQAGEIDGLETISSDFLPVLAADSNLEIVKSMVATIPIMRFNALYPPFDSPAIRRAVLSAIDQTQFMTALMGSDNKSYWQTNVGVFSPGSPMATQAGIGVMKGMAPANLAAARQAIKDAGYKGEKVVLLDPADYPASHMPAMVAADLLKKIGMNVDVQTMDWGTLMQRRASQSAPAAGGWNVHFTTLSGMNNFDPASHLALRANGRQGWFGWPTSDKIEALREQWFDAPDNDARRKICAALQMQVWQDVPYIPLGAYYNASAFRRGWQGISTQMPLFYNLRRA
ncbi:MAG: ABC transporter substrate-binding protein [Janthinobacterium lividum]